MRKIHLGLSIVGALGMLWSVSALLANATNQIIDMVAATGLMVFFGVLFLAGYHRSLAKGNAQ